MDHDTVTRTFTLAAEKLGERAGQIVRMAAYLAPDAIPEDILADGNAPDIEFRDAVADATRSSLIRRNPVTKTIDIHRLVQDVVKDTMDARSAHYWIERVADSLSKSFPEEVEFKTWSLCDRLLPHARIVAAEVLRLSIESPGAARLLNQAAWYLGERAQYKEAEPLLKRAVEIREKALGPAHPDTASSLSDLAGIYSGQGQYKEAEPLLKRALEINEKALGPHHPDTATSLNNLADTYSGQGQYKEAEPLLKRALEIREKALGPAATSVGILGGGVEHPVVAKLAANYAHVLQKLGRGYEAHKLRTRFRVKP